MLPATIRSAHQTGPSRQEPERYFRADSEAFSKLGTHSRVRSSRSCHRHFSIDHTIQLVARKKISRVIKGSSSRNCGYRKIFWATADPVVRLPMSEATSEPMYVLFYTVLILSPISCPSQLHISVLLQNDLANLLDGYPTFGISSALALPLYFPYTNTHSLSLFLFTPVINIPTADIVSKTSVPIMPPPTRPNGCSRCHRYCQTRSSGGACPEARSIHLQETLHRRSRPSPVPSRYG